MVKKRLKLMAAAGIIVIIIAAVFLVLHKTDIDSGIGNTGTKVQYDASDLIKQALAVLKENSQEASLLSDIKTTDKVIALSFKGLSDPDTNQEILKLLKDNNRKGTFFLPGIPSAEDSETVRVMTENGNDIGSNTLSGTTNLQDNTTEELVEDFCRTNNIIETLIGKKPVLLMCNGTEYTKTVLQAAFASGNEKVVTSSHYISYQSFTNYDQVLNYINNLDYGTILTVKLDGALDESEYEPKETSGIPAVDKRPEEEEESAGLTEEERLVEIVGWILKALDEASYKTVPVTDLATYGDSDYSLDFAAEREANEGKLAKVHTNVNTGEKLVSFSFRGIENEENLDDILNFLDENNQKATFFVTGNDILNYEDRIRKILDSGNQIANGGMTGRDLTAMDFKEVCFEIYKCDELLKEVFGKETNIFMPVYGKYNDTVREAVSALGFTLVTYNKNPIIDSDESVTEIMKYFKNGLSKGDIVYFRLDYYKNILELVKQTYALMLAKNYEICSIRALLAAPPLELVSSDTDSGKNGSGSNTGGNTNGKDNNNTSNGTDDNNDLKQKIEELRLKNKGALAKEISTIYTTEQALSFTFTGISNTAVLNDVLKKLDKINAKGTFFVTEQEVEENSAAIKKIAEAGHEIEICLKESQTKDFNSVCSSILDIQEKVEAICGQKPTLVRYAYVVDMTKEMLEAVSSTGCEVVWQDISFTSSKVGKKGTYDQVLAYAYNDGNISARRGYIAFFRLDFYEDKSLIGKLMMNFIESRVNTIAYKEKEENDSSYEIKTLKSLLNSQYVYQYPIKEQNILSAVKDKIYSGHLADMTKEEIFQQLMGRYIGNPDISSSSTLPGFTDEELAGLNTSGRFTDDKVLFLTFDDWGSDKPINQILYVLKKYNVKGAFFIRTNYVQANPNLLRAIAEAGHDVGSHTDEHLPFADSGKIVEEDDVLSIYKSLSEEEVNIRKQDLLTSYKKLQSIIGDVQTDGVAALQKFFRPPTLAMSKEGMEAILDMGFTHIVSGDLSIHDYEAENAKELADTILKGIWSEAGSYKPLQNGSILVLHMSDDSNKPVNQNDITAEALDIVIPKLLKEGYRFAKLSDYLSD